ncbi:unnamed protein product, partial [Rotaria magnacalcarata]
VPRKQSRDSLLEHVSQFIPELPLFFVLGGQIKHGPKLVVLLAVPIGHDREI